MLGKIDIDHLNEIIMQDLSSMHGISCMPFSQENTALIIDGSEEAVENFEKEAADLDVKDLTDGEWSTTEPEDCDYGSIALDYLPGVDVVKDDYGLGEKSRHRFKKKF